MAKEMARGDDGRKQRAAELYERLLEVQQAGRELVLDTAGVLREIQDGGYFRDFGYETFEALAKAALGLEKVQAYQYLKIAENVVGALPEWASDALVRSPNEFSKPLPLKLLAALHFDHISPAQMEKIRSLEGEEQRAELLKLGYDRDRMGGRAASDLMRPQIGRKTYRDQRRKMQLYREQIETLKGEKTEVMEQYKALQDRLDQVLEAIENPQSAKIVKQMDALTVRLAELEKARAAEEAEVATGKEVGTRALVLSGEIQALLAKFEDSVRIDKKAQWVEVRAVLHSAQEAIEQTIGRMAEVIIARVDSGEITRFDVEDPEGESGAAAAGLSDPGEKRKR